LGLVILAEHNQVAAAIAQLQQHGAPSVGEPQGHRIPACVVTRRGHDKDLIAELEGLASVLKVEVAYAQTLEEDEVQ
jgi:hypothetical protein